jgi:hypothetical protein
MRIFLRLFILFLGIGASLLQAQVVPVQANIDAQAQRRLQADAQESARRRRIDENIRRLVPALNPSNLTGSDAPVLTREALAAIHDLLTDGVVPRDSLQQAAKKSSFEVGATQKTSAYLLECWSSIANQVTPEDLERMRKGLEPKSHLDLPPFQP